MTKYSRDPLITLQQHTQEDGRAQGTHIFVNSWFNRNTSITLPSGFHVTIRTAVIRMNFIIGDDSFEKLRPISSVTLSNLVFLLRVDLQYRTRIQLER